MCVMTFFSLSSSFYLVFLSFPKNTCIISLIRKKILGKKSRRDLTYLIASLTHFQKYLKAFHFCTVDHIDDQWDGCIYIFCKSEKRLWTEMLS